MVDGDVKKILAIIKAAYPRFYGKSTGEEIAATFRLWQIMLKDDDYEQVSIALYKHISISEFPPSIADIRKALAETTKSKVITGGEAWEEVLRLMRKYGSYRESEAMENTSPLVASCIRQIGGFRHLCLSEDGMVDRAHFLKIFEIIKVREQEDRVLPNSLKSKILEQIYLGNELQSLGEILREIEG